MLCVDRMRLLIALVPWLLVLPSACGALPSPEKLEAAQIGDPPRKEEAARRATEVLTKSLERFASAQVWFDDPEPGFYRHGPGYSGQRYAWDVVAWVESENRRGFRQPAAPYHFFFLGEKLVATAFPATTWTGRGYVDAYTISEFDGGGLDQVKAGLRKEPLLR